MITARRWKLEQVSYYCYPSTFVLAEGPELVEGADPVEVMPVSEHEALVAECNRFWIDTFLGPRK